MSSSEKQSERGISGFMTMNKTECFEIRRIGSEMRRLDSEKR